MRSNLVHDIFKGVRAVDGEADEDQVGLRVGEWTQSVVFLLAGRIPQRQFHRLTGWRVCGIGDVVLENRGDIFLRFVSAISSSANVRPGGWRRGMQGQRGQCGQCGGAHLWEISLAVADEKTGLAAATVTDDNDLLGVGWALGHGCCG